MAKTNNNSFYKQTPKIPFKIKIARVYIKFLSLLRPSKCDELLVKWFIHPRIDKERINREYTEKHLFDTGTQEYVDFEKERIFSYREGDPTVLLVPGWESSGVRFTNIMEALRRHDIGFVFIDLPAHGRSSGTTNNAVKTARLIHYFLQIYPSISTIVGHSFGGGSSFVALSKNYTIEPTNIQRLITIGSPTHYLSIIHPMVTLLDLSPKTVDRFLTALTNHVGLDFRNYDLTKMDLADGIDVIAFHDEFDNVIPVSDAYRMQDKFLLTITQGLGHRQIMHDPTVINRLIQNIQEMKMKN